MSTGTNKERIEQNNLKLEEIKTQIQNLPETGGSGNVKQFSTVEEMQADTTAKEGDLAVVYGSEIQNATVDSKFQTATFPETVVLDTAMTNYVDVRYRAVDSSVMFDCMGQLDSSMFRMDCYTETGEVRIEYTSSDGITYTRTDNTGNPVDFGTEIYYEMTEMWNDAIGKFIQVGGNTFEGLFEYKQYIDKNSYDCLTNIQSYNKYDTASVTPSEALISLVANLYDNIPSSLNPIGKPNYFSGTLVKTGENTYDIYSALYNGTSSTYYNSNVQGILIDVTNNATYFQIGCSLNTNSYVLDSLTGTGDSSPNYKYVVVKYSLNTSTNTITSQVLPSSDFVSFTSMDSATHYRYKNALNSSDIIGAFQYTVNTNLFNILPQSYSQVVDNKATVCGSISISNTIRYKYQVAKSQFTAMPDDIYGKIAYSKTGVINGTLNNKENLTVAQVLTRVEIWNNFNTGIVCPKNMSSAFSGYKNTTIPLLDTSNVTNTSYMFRYCSNLTTIPELNMSKVTNMTWMFHDCTKLTSISKLDTSSVTNMSNMFNGCSNLTTIPLLDTSSVTTMYGMFQGCSKLTTIPQLDTHSVTTMHNMFYVCTSLTTIPQLDTSNVMDMYCMFNSCRNLTSIPQLDTIKVTNMEGMFDGCTNLTSVPELNTSSVTNMSYMLNGCNSLTTIPELDTSNVTDISAMFRYCTSLSDESLNNILAMCTNATSYTGTKTLKYIGLTSAQATKCRSLSNYSAFIAAGWTTGY